MGNGIMWMGNFMNNFNLVVTLTCSEAESYEVNLFQGFINKENAEINFPKQISIEKSSSRLKRSEMERSM